MRVIVPAVVVLVLSGLSACGRKGDLMPPEVLSQPLHAPKLSAEPSDAQVAKPSF